MAEVAKGSKTDLTDLRYEVTLGAAVDGAVDLMAVLLADDGRVRNDDDFVFFNNPKAPGVHLTSDTSVTVDLSAVPSDVQRVLVAASTEAQGRTFGDVPGVRVEIRGPGQVLEFLPPGPATETVLQVVALYRRGGGWRLDAVGQGYQDGLAAFATDHGIVVDDADDESEPAVSAPKVPPAASPISFEKVQISLTKDSPTQTARIDLRKSQGDPNWVLTVGLEWDGRGATYDRNGNVKKYGTGDLDVYFYCRNEHTNDYIVVSGDPGHRGSLDTWPHIHHYGDSKGPGNGKRPAVEQVRVLPNENGDLLVNIYQSIDNGAGAIDKFGKPRVAIRYGRAGARRSARARRRRDPRVRRQREELVLGDRRPHRRAGRCADRRRRDPVQQVRERTHARTRLVRQLGALPEGRPDRSQQEAEQRPGSGSLRRDVPDVADHRRRPARPRSTTARVIKKVITTPATDRTNRFTSTAGCHDTFPSLTT